MSENWPGNTSSPKINAGSSECRAERDIVVFFLGEAAKTPILRLTCIRIMYFSKEDKNIDSDFNEMHVIQQTELEQEDIRE